MNNNKETKILIISLIACLGIVGLGIWIYWKLTHPEGTKPPTPGQILSENKIILTTGEKELIKTTEAKTKGITAFAKLDYTEAINQFLQSLEQEKNDPEALIYLNNARIGKNESYTIAVIAPVSKTSEKSAEILRGVAQAQKKINSTDVKINGKYLKIMIVDEGDEAEKAKKTADSLAKKPEVLGVIGHYSSGVTYEAGKIYKENKLVAISPTSTSVKLDELGDYIWRTPPSDRIAGNALSNYAINTLKKRKAVIFYDEKSAYSKSLKNVFSENFQKSGGEVIKEFDLQNKNFNAFGYIQQVKSQNAEIIMLAPSSDKTILDKAKLLVTATENGTATKKNKLPILAGDAFYSSNTLEIGNNLAGTVMAIAWHIKAHNNAPFVMEARQLWGADISGRTVTSYDATQAFITALKANPNPTRENIQQTLKKSDFKTEGATSTISFFPTGDRNQPVQLVQVIKSPNSGYEFVPIIP